MSDRPENNLFALLESDTIPSARIASPNQELLVPSESGTEDLRRKALIAFLGAGMTPPPSTALLVSSLANARRSVAAHQAGGTPLDQWLEDEMHYSGIRENAAALATMELPDMRDRTASEYSRRHPDRAQQLQEILRYLRAE